MDFLLASSSSSSHTILIRILALCSRSPLRWIKSELFLSLETAKVTAEADVEADEDARFAAAVDAQEGVESAPELEGG